MRRAGTGRCEPLVFEKVAADGPAGSREPRRFTVAAQVLEHFSAKWKPAFQRETGGQATEFTRIPATRPAAPCSTRGSCAPAGIDARGTKIPCDE